MADDWPSRPTYPEALRLYPREVVEDIARMVPFADDERREEFPKLLLRWAALAILSKQSDDREPTPKEVRDEFDDLRKDLDRVPERLDALSLDAEMRMIMQLDPTDYDNLAPDDYKNMDPKPIVMASAKFAEVKKNPEQLANCVVSAHESIEVKSGRPTDYCLRIEIFLLTEFWEYLTSKRARRTWDNKSKREAGRFCQFIHMAIAPIWPEKRSVNGLIRHVLAKMDGIGRQPGLIKSIRQ